MIYTQRPGSPARTRAFVLLSVGLMLFAASLGAWSLAATARAEELPLTLALPRPETVAENRADDEAVRLVDQALIVALSTAGVDVLHMVRVDPPNKPDPMLQYIEITTPAQPDIILDALDKALADVAPTAALVSLAPDTVQVSYNDAPTHIIILHAGPGLVATPRPVQDEQPTAATVEAAGKPRLAIVIDDLGESLKPARELAQLGLPLTFSVFPYGPATPKIVEVGRAAGFDIILHQPMEPLDAGNNNPGVGAIYCRMSDEQIKAALRENLKRVPAAVAMNNHMGSRFTQDERGLAAVVEVLRERKLFCLDSLTHPKSRFMVVAARLNVPGLKRDVFLDLVRERDAVLRELKHAERIARARGAAVAIAHPVATTIAALRAWKSQRDASITLVPLSALRP